MGIQGQSLFQKAHMMKLYIADKTCSEAVQIIANELGLNPTLIHYNVHDRTTSSGENFAEVNPLGYVPVLVDDQNGSNLTETIVIISHLADRHLEARLIAPRGTMERSKIDQLLTFVATEIAQKHIPLMRKLMTENGAAWTRNKLASAYKVIDELLADGRPFITGNDFTVVDAYVWATMWHERSDARIDHLKNLLCWKMRVDERPSVQKTLRDEADIVAQHLALVVAK